MRLCSPEAGGMQLSRATAGMSAWRGSASEDGPLACANVALCLHAGGGGKSAEQDGM